MHNPRELTYSLIYLTRSANKIGNLVACIIIHIMMKRDTCLINEFWIYNFETQLISRNKSPLISLELADAYKVNLHYQVCTM